VKAPCAIFLLVLVIPLCGCESQPATAPVELRFLPLVAGDPLQRTCGDSTLGDGVSADSLGPIGAVRLVVRNAESAIVYDSAVVEPVPGAGVKFDDVPVGSGYSVSASVCGTAEGPSSWVGSATGVQVKDRATTKTQVHMLPVAGYACARTEDDKGTPEAPHLFASAWSGDGRTALVAGGIADSPAGAVAAGSSSITVYDRASDTWSEAGSLPGPLALASSTAVSPTPGAAPRLLLIGGLAQVTIGDALDAEVSRLGPPADADPASAVAGAYWLGADGKASLADGVPSRYAAGVASLDTPDGSVVGIAGGITYEGGQAQVSDQFHIVEMTAAGPVVREPVTLKTPRIAPRVIALPDKRVFIVIGGGVQTGGFSDADTLRNLVEIVPLAPPVARGVAVTISIPPGTPEGVLGLVGPSAWPTVVLTEDNHLVVIGGFPLDGPVILDTARVAPVAFRLQIGATTPTAMTLDTPVAWAQPGMVEWFARTLPMEVTTPAQVLLSGGFGIAQTPEKPRQDAIQIDRVTGAVSATVDVPYFAIGSSATSFADGSTVISGGLVESGSINQLAVTNFAALRAGDGLGDCVPIPLDAEDGEDAGDVGMDLPPADLPEPPMGDVVDGDTSDAQGDVPGDAPADAAVPDAMPDPDATMDTGQ
jgi:hypothetical protein